jgi:hypothetical protein
VGSDAGLLAQGECRDGSCLPGRDDRRRKLLPRWS